MTTERGDGALMLALRRAERSRRLQAFALVAPLLVFLLFSFIIPIGDMLRHAVQDTELSNVWPRAANAMHHFTGTGLPPDSAFEALAADLKESAEASTVATAARRLNYAIDGGRSMVMKTARAVDRMDTAPPDGWRAALTTIDPAWDDPKTWREIESASGPVTDFFLLSALDHQRNPSGTIVAKPANEQIYLTVLGRTFLISGLVTVIALLLGFPLAYCMTTSRSRVTVAVLTLVVLLPFWTSLLVRTAAWIVLLQDQGIINKTLMWLGVIDHPIRLIYNRVGVVVAMVHILLPFMVLPIASVMRGIKPDTLRAARSLGAPPITAYRRIYLPQTLPGVAAGVLLVFISAIGYYITPALVGGADDQMMSYFIAFYTTDTVNWGLAAALGVLLLIATAILSLIYAKLASQRNALFG
jgi:putative spermidine/putrescine transport system permease protein